MLFTHLLMVALEWGWRGYIFGYKTPILSAVSC